MKECYILNFAATQSPAQAMHTAGYPTEFQPIGHLPDQEGWRTLRPKSMLHTDSGFSMKGIHTRI